jgi:hypothetical protein
MRSLSHFSAKSYHYNKEAASYDAFNENRSKPMNQRIESILKNHNIKKVLDLTYETGFKVLDQCSIDGSKLIEIKVSAYSQSRKKNNHQGVVVKIFSAPLLLDIVRYI